MNDVDVEVIVEVGMDELLFGYCFFIYLGGGVGVVVMFDGEFVFGLWDCVGEIGYV